MTMDTKLHIELLQNLITFSKPLDELAGQLALTTWDCEVPIATLMAIDVASVLQRHIKLEISTEEVLRWANYLEGREDIDFEPSKKHKIQEILHELANPFLTQELTTNRAEELVQMVT
jgi:hypothetical protein